MEVAAAHAVGDALRCCRGSGYLDTWIGTEFRLVNTADLLHMQVLALSFFPISFFLPREDEIVKSASPSHQSSRRYDDDMH